MKPRNFVRHSQQGFSLIELLIVVAVMGIVSPGILSQMDTAQQRNYSEQGKLDNFQEARDFVAQFFRDLNQIGYPNLRLLHPTPAWSPALTTQTAYTYA